MKYIVFCLLMAITMSSASANSEEISIFSKASPIFRDPTKKDRDVPNPENLVRSEINYVKCIIGNSTTSRMSRLGNAAHNEVRAHLADLVLEQAKISGSGKYQNLRIPLTPAYLSAVKEFRTQVSSFRSSIEQEFRAEGKRKGLKGFAPSRYADRKVKDMVYMDTMSGKYGSYVLRTNQIQNWFPEIPIVDPIPVPEFSVAVKSGYAAKLLAFLIVENITHKCSE